MNEIDQTRTLRAQGTAIDRMICITLDMDNAGGGIFAPSPSPYIRMPQPTEQYGQVLRVSVVRESLYCRTSASAAVGINPSRARLEPATVEPVILRNCRREICVMAILVRGNSYRVIKILNDIF